MEGARFETDGPGLGFVDIYSSTGRLLRRLEHGDWLNARGAWLWLRLISDASATICSSGSSRGRGDPSSGFIAAYDLATGKLDGLLQDASGKPLAINGVWALSREMSAQLITMPQPHPPQRCTSPPDQTTPPEACSVT